MLVQKTMLVRRRYRCIGGPRGPRRGEGSSSMRSRKINFSTPRAVHAFPIKSCDDKDHFNLPPSFPPSFPPSVLPSLRSILKEGKAAGHAICGGHVSGMFGFFFTEGPVRCFTDAAKSDTVRQTPSCPSSFLSLVRAFSDGGSPPTVHVCQPAFEQLLSFHGFCVPPWHTLVARSLLSGLDLRFPPSPPTPDLPAARPVDAGSLSDPKPSLPP
jgi:hypothetical protein